LRIFVQQVIFSQSLNGELVSFAKNANLGLFWAKKALDQSDRSIFQTTISFEPFNRFF
jgi:hypothetical protein